MLEIWDVISKFFEKGELKTNLILTPWTGEKYGSFSLAENSAKCFIALVWPQFENGGSEKCYVDYLDINILA